MKEVDIDEVLKAAPSSGAPRPETLRRVTAIVQESLRPVRPLPPAWLLTAALFLAGASVALGGAARAGFDGFQKMALWERALIFPTLGLFMLVAAHTLVKAVIPGSRRRVSSRSLLALGMLALIAVFALSFRDYHVENFVSAGIACLVTGLLHALPVALIVWLLLRRGFAVAPVAAGWIAGMLAGLAGIGVLELHCVNFEAAHVLVWHTAVVPVSGALAALAAAIWQRLRRMGSS